MRSKFLRKLVVFTAISCATCVIAAEAVPPCRFENSKSALVKNAIQRTVDTYEQLGRSLPFQEVSVNDADPPPGYLRVYIVKDASKNALNFSGCALRAPTKDDQLDELSVRGGCFVTSENALEVRCSSEAVSIFADMGTRLDRENPALLYVLAHELGHLYQQQSGEYSGQFELVNLNASRATKLAQLQSSCDPTSVRKEQEADNLALDVLKLDLGKAPYRETTFSERGSILWNIDLLALASERWTKASLQRELQSNPKLHPSFEPTEFPTPQAIVKKNAHRFVCDVLSKKSGRIFYPRKSETHPPVEQRLRRIAEELLPVAKSLPNTGGSLQFTPIKHLQEDLSPIFTKIYQEIGVYLEAEYNEVCTIVNATISPNCK